MSFARQVSVMLIRMSPTAAPCSARKNKAFFRLWKAFHSRKNALFYRTLHGAEVGDLFMSLIHTCELCGVNSFEYLTELQRHARELATEPSRWIPWNYRDTLAQTN